MADAVNSQTLFDGDSQAVMKFNNVSDGTGESAVLKVDVSALKANFEGKACTGVSIRRITAMLHGISVNVLWDADTDVSAVVLAPGMYTLNYRLSGRPFSISYRPHRDSGSMVSCRYSGD